MPDHITKGGFTNLFPKILRMKIDKYISVQSNICMCLYMCVCACICVSRFNAILPQGKENDYRIF